MPQGDISPITPKQSPSENMEVDSPPRPPSAYTPPPRPAEGFTPPLPPTQILGLGASPPKAPTALQPPPPPPPPAASDSGGEASMSSISDTDLGEVSFFSLMGAHGTLNFRCHLRNHGGIFLKSLPMFPCPPPPPHLQVCGIVDSDERQAFLIEYLYYSI